MYRPSHPARAGLSGQLAEDVKLQGGEIRKKVKSGQRDFPQVQPTSPIVYLAGGV